MENKLPQSEPLEAGCYQQPPCEPVTDDWQAQALAELESAIGAEYAKVNGLPAEAVIDVNVIKSFIDLVFSTIQNCRGLNTGNQVKAAAASPGPVQNLMLRRRIQNYFPEARGFIGWNRDGEQIRAVLLNTANAMPADSINRVLSLSRTI